MLKYRNKSVEKADLLLCQGQLEFRFATAQNEPTTDYKVDKILEYGCFASGGFSDVGQN